MKLNTLGPRVPIQRTRTAQVQPTQRIRGRELQHIREAHFRDHPICVKCEELGQVRAAFELDHIVPLYKGGKDVKANRQGLCRQHHLEKTKVDLDPRG